MASTAISRGASRKKMTGTYIVRISEETDTRNHTGTNMIPSKRRLIDLGEREPSALVRVLNMSKVVMEVVESGIATRSLDDGGRVNGRHCVSLSK
jgi:hypothetical protein